MSITHSTDTQALNRAGRRKAGLTKGRGRTGVAILSGVLALSVAAPALAAPPVNPTPGGSNPTPQTTNPVPVAPPAAPSNTGPGVVPDPPSNNWQANPWTNNAPANWAPAPGNSGPAITVGPAVIKAPPPMILPEPGMIRIGTFQEEKPAWVTVAEMNSINRWSAYLESRLAQALMTVNPKLTEDKALQQAATMMVGGVVGGAAGGAAGFALGVVPGALAGAGIGALVGTGIGFGVGIATGTMLLPILGPAGPPIMITQGAVGALIGAPVGAAVGAVIGGAIGGVVVGIPLAALGVGIGSVLGTGDPNQEINQPWTKRDGKGNIVPKENVLEFDWNGTKADPRLKNVKDAHVNVQVKDDDTWVVKFGDERWMGATKAQRDKHFYGEIDKHLPGAGAALGNWMEDKDGSFQTTIKGFMGDQAKQDPKNTHYNPDGSVDPKVRETRVPYGSTPTPDPWDEPNRKGLKAQEEHNREGVGQAPPVKDQATKADAQVVAPAATPASYDYAPLPARVEPQAPTVLPSVPQGVAPVVQQAVDQAQKLADQVAPGFKVPAIPGLTK